MPEGLCGWEAPPHGAGCTRHLCRVPGFERPQQSHASFYPPIRFRARSLLSLSRRAPVSTRTMATLPRRPLGNTGLEVSVLGFGASPLGSVFEVRPPAPTS